MCRARDKSYSISIYMGKRLALLIAVIVPLSGSVLHAPATTGPEKSSFREGIQSVRAQELPKSATIAEDSIVERPSVAKAKVTKRASKIVDVWVTAYSSSPAETDDTPFITASGTNVRDGVAASNIFPIGTKFKLPDYFGDKVFVVEDRMNERYNNTHIVDIWFSNQSDALEFGKRTLTLEVL